MCGTWLEFIFDHNMEYTDTFARQVGTVDVHFFDESGRHTLTRSAGQGTLTGGNRMWVDGDLPSGTYTVVTVGAPSPEFRFEGATLRQATLSLMEGAPPDRRLPDVWLGPATGFRHGADAGVCRVALVRETNHFDITLTWMDQGDLPTTITSLIVAPEAGVYDCRNRPATTSRTGYAPYRRTVESRAVVSLATATMRLIENLPGGYYLEVRDEACEGDGSTIWSHNLLALLEDTKPATRPDGSPLPMQEYLDRRGEWDIEIHLAPGPGDNPLVTTVAVNGWIVWTHGVDV